MPDVEPGDDAQLDQEELAAKLAKVPKEKRAEFIKAVDQLPKNERPIANSI